MTRHADATLYIDLEAIAANYDVLRRNSGESECAAVVKADAYGLGVKPVAQKLFSEGCKKFFVATLDEALILREILPQVEIYVFHGLSKGQEQYFFINNLIPVLNDFHQVELWSQFSIYSEKNLPCIIHVDTGMNRLGFNIKDAEKLAVDLDLISTLDIKYIMSHLACIGTPSHKKNTEQLKKFNHIRKFFPGIPATLSNSAATLGKKCYHFDMVRPGCSLYGINSAPSAKPGLHNVVKLIAKVLQIREIDTRQSVGYGATREVRGGSRLATVPVGYADGYLRSLSNNSFGFCEGVKVPLVGRVSMDMLVFDITKVPVSKLNDGTEIELIGDKCTADMLAKMAGTIGYEILTSLGGRYKREYLNGD